MSTPLRASGFLSPVSTILPKRVLRRAILYKDLAKNTSAAVPIIACGKPKPRAANASGLPNSLPASLYSCKDCDVPTLYSCKKAPVIDPPFTKRLPNVQASSKTTLSSGDKAFKPAAPPPAILYFFKASFTSCLVAALPPRFKLSFNIKPTPPPAIALVIVSRAWGSILPIPPNTCSIPPAKVGLS